jgi:signal peptide peptidase SppA
MDIHDLLDRLPFETLKPPPLVSVVRLSGVIGDGRGGGLQRSLSLAGLAATLEKAFKPKHLVAVALAINSPGGSPAQSSLIAGRIRQLADEKKIPVFAFVEDVAASGGYWLATAADEIFVDGASIVGSIGVVSAGFGFTQLIEKIGIERRVHAQGARKAMLDPFRPERDEDVERLLALQVQLHDGFKGEVRRRRGAKLTCDDATLFEGDIWIGQKAVELGLADGIGDLRSVLRDRFGEKVKMTVVGGQESWLRRRFGLTAGPGVWVQDALLAIEDRLHWARYGL